MAIPMTPFRFASTPLRRSPTNEPLPHLAPDGQCFLMLKAPGTDANAAPPSLIVVQHFDQELKARVPVK